MIQEKHHLVTSFVFRNNSYSLDFKSCGDSFHVDGHVESEWGVICHSGEKYLHLSRSPICS